MFSLSVSDSSSSDEDDDFVAELCPVPRAVTPAPDPGRVSPLSLPPTMAASHAEKSSEEGNVSPGGKEIASFGVACARNGTCIRGYKHGGKGGRCKGRVAQPTPTKKANAPPEWTTATSLWSDPRATYPSPPPSSPPRRYEPTTYQGPSPTPLPPPPPSPMATGSSGVPSIPLRDWYTRCECQPSNPTEQDNQSLVRNGEECTHYILGAAIMKKLKRIRVSTDTNETLYKAIKGKLRSDSAIYNAIGRMKMGGLQIVVRDRAVSGNNNVIFGLVPRALGDDPPSSSSSSSSSSSTPLDEDFETLAIRMGAVEAAAMRAKARLDAGTAPLYVGHMDMWE